jgi:hypothetical protein
MELPKPHRERLLETPLERVPAGTADALAAFCADRPEVRRAFLCEVERTVEGEEPTRGLSFAVDLTWPVAEPEDSRGVSPLLASALVERDPELVREVGVAVLADRAVPAWQRLGQTIYQDDEGRP